MWLATFFTSTLRSLVVISVINSAHTPVASRRQHQSRHLVMQSQVNAGKGIRTLQFSTCRLWRLLITGMTRDMCIVQWSQFYPTRTTLSANRENRNIIHIQDWYTGTVCGRRITSSQRKTATLINGERQL